MTNTLTDRAATKHPEPNTPTEREGLPARIVRLILTQRIVLLGLLLVILLVVMFSLDAAGQLSGSFDTDYLASSLINVVPLAMLAVAEMVVIVSGRGGIDLSVGAIVSLAGMVFGLSYGEWGWPIWLAIIVAVAFGGLCGAVNGFLIAYLGFPALIATLATFYAYKSLALVINNQAPVNTKPIQDLYSSAQAVQLPIIGEYIPNFPLGLFTFLIPTLLVAWLLITKTTYGRRLFAIGTNDVAAKWAGMNVASTRARAYVISGLLSGLVSVVTVAQFASARPDSGVSGNGMALPAITIAVLGGVAITGGIGRISGLVLASLLIVWLNAGLLLLIAGNASGRYQLLALGAVLVFAAVLNGITSRRYSGAK
ncbi:ABC transporter permease [Subtercola endophyticus]|uniref:ABC transporter permease n=1 Tax=Subtercola endophyticus TaxID=2895559 RepID=UPI001E4C50B5|nr:ABC transporter permease [Subtercola endophyticus]UFS58821.1 ABC transporter permease [Subtercola endophyticus]